MNIPLLLTLISTYRCLRACCASTVEQLTNVDHILKGVAGLSSLRYLSVMHNPCTPDCFAAGKDVDDYAKFRLHIIYKIQSLCCLDYQDVTPGEREKASAVGAFAKTASPREAGGGGGGGASSAALADVDAAVGEVEDDSLTRGSESHPSWRCRRCCYHTVVISCSADRCQLAASSTGTTLSAAISCLFCALCRG
eukprot:COSAG06_NODE_2453_length_6854_cov_6.728463_12_plen_195_part_00